MNNADVQHVIDFLTARAQQYRDAAVRAGDAGQPLAEFADKSVDQALRQAAADFRAWAEESSPPNS